MEPGQLPAQIGNKTECGLLGFVIDLGVDYRQVGDLHFLEKKISSNKLNRMTTGNGNFELRKFVLFT